MSLYLKYRSKDFDDIVEQDYTKAILKQQVLQSAQGEHFSNYLFYGSRGIGKTSIARILAKALNCLHSKDGNPCNTCDSCKLISENRAMDIIEIDAASHTGVDNIREEIIGKAVYPPVQLRKKVTIIDEVHMLSTGAFNALLKIMEEPPSYLVFILATTELHKVPETIASRCQVFNFKRITEQGIIQRLKYICEEEKFQYDNAGLAIIARIVDGGMRDAVKYLDQVSILGIIDEKTVTQCLGITSESVIKDFVRLYEQRDSKQLIQIINHLQDDGVDIFIFLKEILSYVDRTLDVEHLGILELAQFIKNCFEKLKYFPHPYVLMKSEIASLGSSQVNQVTALVHNNVSSNVIHETKSQSQQPDVKEEEVIQSNQTLVNDNNQIISNTNNQTTKKMNNQQGSAEYDDLKERIIRNIASPSIQSIRESACYIDSINDSSMIVHVIENGKMILLNMTKNKQDVEKICSEILGRSISLQYQFVDKEDFLRKGLDGLLA